MYLPVYLVKSSRKVLFFPESRFTTKKVRGVFRFVACCYACGPSRSFTLYVQLGWDCFPSGKIVALAGSQRGVKLFHFLQFSFTVDGEKVEERTTDER